MAAIFFQEAPVVETIWTVRGQLVGDRKLFFCFLWTVKVRKQSCPVHMHRSQFWSKQCCGGCFLQCFLEVTGVCKRNSQIHMCIRRFRLATRNAPKEGDGIGMFADSTLDFAKQ